MRHRHLQLLATLSALAVTFAALVAPFTITTTGAQQRSSAIDTYAITGARIITVSGPAIERGTIVIRNGLIAAVGPNTNAPADARMIDGAGLTVYPGLIDANTTLGMSPPAPPATTAARPGAGGGAAILAQQSTVASSPNSSQPPGLQPEILAVDLIQPAAPQIEMERSAGLTAALTAPREGIFIGQSAFINLAGDTAQQMILRAPVALHVGFTPLRGGTYPGSLMGVFAALRQMLLDAGRYREAQQIYERNPRGLRRPEQDKSLAALSPVLAREMPVVMNANTEREISRALDLAQEFNLRAIIAGGSESWKVATRLRAMNVPVLLSLNFPRRTTAFAPEADPDPVRVLRERVEAPKTAAKLASAGVRFAFQSGAMTNIADFITNAGKTVENGLAKDVALRAMTIRAAEILGVADRLGTIEAGKIANLTITRGDIFDRTARLAHVFIDGRPIDLKPAAAAALAGTTTAAGASGTWTLNVNLGEGEAAVTLILQQEGEQLRGSIQGALGSAQIANASAGAGGDLRFTAPVNIGGQTTEATFNGTIAGNEMRGTVQIVGRAPGTFTGTRPLPRGSASSLTNTTRTPDANATTTSSAPTSSSTDLSGTWTLMLTVGERSVAGTLNLRQEGANISGTLETPFGTSELANGSAGADGFRFTSTADLGGRTVEMTITGTANANEMRGTITSEIGASSFIGTRPR